MISADKQSKFRQTAEVNRMSAAKVNKLWCHFRITCSTAIGHPGITAEQSIHFLIGMFGSITTISCNCWSFYIESLALNVLQLDIPPPDHLYLHFIRNTNHIGAHCRCTVTECSPFVVAPQLDHQILWVVGTSIFNTLRSLLGWQQTKYNVEHNDNLEENHVYFVMNFI